MADALKRYGAIVADNGSPRYLTGEESPGWDNAQLDGLCPELLCDVLAGRVGPDTVRHHTGVLETRPSTTGSRP
ncbi:hypothetical protein [Streptomyces sp. NBC_01207]|uniref:hypothetical protein n=1 Tax=Streptomyces sp. NBC_01207 TaxID=2903772 RepID=UPI002E0FF731|nr:hypothetical protein OG457_04380 [Streptomyces sp. NBC_01207]